MVVVGYNQRPDGVLCVPIIDIVHDSWRGFLRAALIIFCVGEPSLGGKSLQLANSQLRIKLQLNGILELYYFCGEPVPTFNVF